MQHPRTIVRLPIAEAAIASRRDAGNAANRQRRFLDDPGLGVSDTALAHAGAAARRSGSTIFALHRNAQNQALGWESISPPQAAKGRITYRYTSGARRGVFWTPSLACTRLVIASGPLQVLQIASAEGPRSHTCYLAPGGVWTPTADEVLDEVLHRGTVTEVALSLTPDHAGTTAATRIRTIVAYHPQVTAIGALVLPLSTGERAA
jgi:hypothetical protein